MPEVKEKTPYHVEYSRKVQNAITSGNAPWQKPVPADRETARNAAKEKPYAVAVNAFSLEMEEKSDPRWMSFEQIKYGKGLKLKKGSEGVRISFYQNEVREQKRDGYGNLAYTEEGKPDMQHVQLDKPIFRTPPVFNGEDIIGLPPLARIEPDSEAREMAAERAETLLVKSGAVFEHDAKPGQEHFDRFSDKVHLAPRESYENREQYLASAIHQLTHWTGHENRLNRTTGPNGSLPRSREELVSEQATWLVMRDIGLTGVTPPDHSHHKSGYLNLLEKQEFAATQIGGAADEARRLIMGLERKKDIAREVPHDREAELEQKGPQTVAVAMPTHELEGMQVKTPVQEFTDALENVGLTLGDKPLVTDGTAQAIERGTYTANFNDGAVPEGIIKNHDTGAHVDFTANGHTLTPEALKTQKDAALTLRQERKIEREAEKEKKLERGQDGKNIPTPPKKAQGRDRGLGL